MTRSRGRVRRMLRAAVLVVAVVLSLVMANAAQAMAEPARSRQLALPPSPSPGPAVTEVTAVPSHIVAREDPARRAFTPLPTAWPAAANASITVASPAARQVAALTRGAGMPVWVQAIGDRKGHDGGPGSVDVSVLARERAVFAGINGVVLTVAAGSASSGPVRIGVDYSSFAQAYGGNYGSRLRMVSLPSCVLTTPKATGCSTATRLDSRNDVGNSAVSAPVRLADAGQTVVLAVTSDPGTEGGAGGTYAATDLKPSGSWTGGGSTGSFTYQYPLALPPAVSSLAPKVALAYDSASVDGQTASTQAQASWVGDGWSTPHSFIEQSFTSCSDSPEGTASPVSTSDMCYNGPILTLSLNGSSTSLVWDSTTSVWKPQNDDGAVVTHVTNSSNGTGTYNTDYWTVTDRSGTVYSFGRNQLPGWSSGKATTNSVDTEPVYSSHSGNPCFNAAGFASSVCTMAYRWNLDYVKDLHGNAMSYYYTQDTNFYGRNNGATMASYVRDSRLNHIDYGFTDGNAYGTVPNKVVFNTGDRCVSGTCQPLNATNKANWPDVPYDLVCASGATCPSWGPAFFSTVRLTSIVTQQYSTATSTYVPVDTYALVQTIPPTGDGTSPTLWLSTITRTGSDTTAPGSAAIVMPPIQFDGFQLQNRVDTVTDGLPLFYKYRIAFITTETGAVIKPSYGLANPCTAPVTISPSANPSSCYPVSWTPTGYTAPITDWFNKYVVTKVTSTDPKGGAPALLTSYSYLGGAAWHYDDNELVKAKYRTYGQFRGYGDVKVFNGDGVNDRQALTETTFYRGMSKNNNTTVVNVTDSATGAHEDVNELAGNVLESTSYLGNGGPVDQSTITSYWVSGAAATRNRTGLPALTAKRVASVQTYSRQAITGSGATTWRYTETDTAYDATLTSPTYGLPLRTYTHTVPAHAAYDRCTTTTYAAANTTVNLVGLAAETETVSVACGGFTQGSPASIPGGVNTLSAPGSVSRPSQVVSDTRTYYDDTTWSTVFPQTTAPTKGDATMVRAASDYTAGAYTYKTKSRAAYDAYGRIVDTYDGNNSLNHNAYVMNSVGLTTAVTTANPLNQNTSSTLDPLRGLTLTATDINGIITTQQYDALGRLTSVWLNSRTTAVAANNTFTYQVSNAANVQTAVTTQKLNEISGYFTSTLIYDALLRPRQTQTMTPRDGRMVTDTFYDSRGWVTSKNNGWWNSTTDPNTTLVAPSGTDIQLPSQNFYTYDGLGRVVYDRSAQNNGVVSTTTTVYNGDRTTVIPPIGGITKTNVTDPLGRVVEIDEYSTLPTLNTPADTFTGTFSTTGGVAVPVTYGFDGHGNQSTVTEPGPHTWTSTFDLLGHVISKSDPDAGTTTGIHYDGNGNLIESTDSRSKTVSYTYDALGRKTGSYTAAVTAQSSSNQTAKWVYDNSDNALVMTNPKGHLTSSTAYSAGNAYTSQQKDFNVFGESLGVIVTIPAVEGNLSGTYTFTHVYTANTGLLLKDGYPAQGGLPAETVLHVYGAHDLPDGLGKYAQTVTYDAWGRVLQTTSGANPNAIYVGNTWDPHTGRLTDQLVTRAVGTPSNVDEQAYTYDLSGNITKQTQTRLGSTATSETQCFQYDKLDQLTQAWTATDSCAATPTTGSSAMVGDALGTSSAYWTTWTVDPIGWRSQVQHSTTGGTDTTTNYAYTATGQPHTLTSATSTGGTPGGSTYTYDTAGNMITRNAGQGNQTLTWDDNRQLAAINGSTGGNTTFLYDADGELLLQKDPGTTTLYLGGQQHTLTTATGVITGTRYYKLPGGGTAIRTGTADTAITFAIGDQHGTPTLYLDYTGQTPAWRQYTPYGAPRGTVITTVDNHGFLDKPLNATTGLTQVGARNYDPQTGRFISLDPILETTDPQQLNGYGYGANNPNTQADPSGLMLPNDPNGSSSAGNPTPNPQPWGDGRPVEPQCLTVKISGSCTASGSFLRQANIANHSTQNGIDRAESQGGSCVPYAMQVVCFNSEGFLADGHPQTVGDVLLFPGSRSDFELLLKGEEKTRSDIANRCDKQGHCLDPNVFGPDLLGHEAAHSDQWTHYSGLVDFGAAYAIEQANSSHICGEYGVCNKFEVNANPFKGGYWKAPTVSNGSFVVAPGSTEHAKRFMCQNWSVPGWNASHWYTTSMCL